MRFRRQRLPKTAATSIQAKATASPWRWWSMAPPFVLLGAIAFYLGSGGSQLGSQLLGIAMGLSLVSSGWFFFLGRWEEWRVAGLNALDRGDLEGARRSFTRCLHAGWLLPRRTRIAVLRGLIEGSRRQGDLVMAERWSRRLLRLEQSIFGPEHRQCAAALNNLACLCQSQQKVGDAIELYRQSVEIWRQTAPEDADCAVTLRNLGQLHSVRGNHVAAEPCLRQALAIQEKILAPPAELSVSRKMLAQSCLAQGQAEEAEWLLQRACRAAVQAWGIHHPRVAQLRSDLAQFYASQGRYGEADECFRLSLETLRRGASLTHPEGAGVLEQYAAFLQHAADIPPDAAQC